MSALAGTAYVTIDGKSYTIAGEGSYMPSSVSREALIGQDGWHGYSEKPQAGKISWKGRDSGSLSIKQLNEASDATVVLVLINGKTVIGRNMVRTGEPIAVNTEDATFDVEFQGPDVTEN